MRLLLIGCTGFVGRELVPFLLRNGHILTILTRKKVPGLFLKDIDSQINYLQLDPSNLKSWEQPSILRELSKADGVINLAGEPIADKRWTENHCKKIASSRINSTKGLIKAMNTLKKPPKVLINASAIGYYGTSISQIFNEDSAEGKDFLSTLCRNWEIEASKKPKATRLLIIRIGLVIASDGGALGKMLPVFKAGFAGPIGTGVQWMSWIHRSDLCQIIQNGLNQKAWKGIVNAVSPQAVSMKEFALILGNSIDRPSLVSVPGAIVKLILGDGAKVVLEGQHVKSIRLSKLGFKHKFETLSKALKKENN